MQRPSLIIYVELAGSRLGSNGQEQFVRAVISQVEYGALNLLDAEHPQLTILMDCYGLSPFGFPIQTFRSCATLLQDHYPNRLGCLLVVRLPSVARVITQTLFQVLKPRTQEKLTIVGEDYQEVLSRYFEELPPFLGGRCSCSKCSNEVTTVEERTRINHGDGAFSNSELCDGSRLDRDWAFIKTAIVGAFLLWICLLYILAVYNEQIMVPLLYNRNGS
ncbi:hypothetical protein L1887_09228 [Cichorium endivia]|nr:hypothetical protein L1887_09228 [Cichorium endivia]